MMDVFDPQPPSSALVASICRCSSPQEHADRAIAQAESSSRAERERVERDASARVLAAEKRAADLKALTPDAATYLVEKVERVGAHLVMQVRYPNCKLCAHEGLKTMVFLHVSEVMVLRWRRIDPHFRGPTTDPTEAPSPAARFPGNKLGWADAMMYARAML